MNLPPLLKRWDSLGGDALLAYQGKTLHRYLRDCAFPFSPYYREVCRDRGLTAADFSSVSDLAKLPFISKADLLPTPADPDCARKFILIPNPAELTRRPRVILRALTRGRAAVRDELDREYRPTFLTSTTGRSAEPVGFLYTQRDLANLGVAAGRIATMGGCGRDERVLNMFPYAPHLAYWMLHQAGLVHNMFCLGTGGGKFMGTEGNLRMIKRLKPTVLGGMPTFVYHVLSQAVENGDKLDSIRIVLLGGEKVAPGARRKLFDCCEQLGSKSPRIVATYGFTEAKMAWAECDHPPDSPSSGFHLFPDMGIIEIIDPQTGHVQPHGRGGEIVWTPLVARGTVVLRYRTGDFSEHGLTCEPCPYCGKTMPRLVGKISRVSDKRALRFQKIKGTIIDFNELELLLDNTPDLGAWQVEIRKRNDDPDEVDELIVHAHRASGDTDEALAQRIRAQFTNTLEIAPNQIIFHSADEIRRLQKVSIALKEERVIDHRDLAGTRSQVVLGDAPVRELALRPPAAREITRPAS